MGNQDVKELLDQRPFKAFRIYLTNGLAFDIRHPDQCMVGRTAAQIASGQAQGLPDQLRGKLVTCSLGHITHMVELD